MVDLMLSPVKKASGIHSNADVSIVQIDTAHRDNKYGITLRNEILDNLQSDYIRLGITMDKKRLFILESNARDGYKISSKHGDKKHTNGYVQIMWDELKDWTGNYTLFKGTDGYFINNKEITAKNRNV